MKIVLANFPWHKNGKWGVRAGSRWPHLKTEAEGDYLPFPFYLSYAAALLEKSGYEVKIIDALADKIKEKRFLEIVFQEAPDLLIAEVSTPSLKNDLEIIECFAGSFQVGICGPESSIRQEIFLQKHAFIDYVLIGEYEYTLLDLVKQLSKNKKLNMVRGLMYREKGRVVVNPVRPLIEDLDGLSWPLRRQLPMEKYLDAPGEMPLPSVQMVASRGCPFGCIFCFWPQVMYGGNSYRVRNVIEVIEEMEYLVNEMGFRSVYFDDDTFNVGKERMLSFCSELKKRNSQGRINVPWAIMARPDLMDEEILLRMKETGLHAVKYGVESVVPEILERSGKKMNIEKADKMIRFTRELGVKVHLTFTFGLPGETKRTMEESINYALEVDPDSVQFSITTPFPGTKFYKLLEENKYLCSRNLADYDGNNKSVIRTDSLSPQDLEEGRLKADIIWKKHREKRMRKKALTDILAQLPKIAVATSGTSPLGTSPSSTQRNPGSPGQFPRVIKLEKKHFFQVIKNSVRKNGLLPTLLKISKFLQPAGMKKYYLEIMGILDGGYAYTGPGFVQIDLTNSCNNDCLGCWCNSPLLGSRKINSEVKKQSLPAEVVRRIIDELFQLGTREIAFVGGGEATLHPQFIDLVSYVKQKGLKCYVSTNFTLWDRSLIQQIIDLKVDQLAVSIWAGTASTYVETHPGQSRETFERIIDNLKLIHSLKDRYPEIKICNVINKRNYFELEKMVDLAIAVGAEAVEFNVLDVIPQATDSIALQIQEIEEVFRQGERINSRLEQGKVDGKLIISNFAMFHERLKSEGASIGEYDYQLVKNLPCCVGWTFARIMANGEVNSCLKSHRIPVGNIYQQSLKEIWNSTKQIEFRQQTYRRDKEGGLFASIGNDPQTKIGCYRACDDLIRNMNYEQRINSLSKVEKALLLFLVNLKKRKRKLSPDTVSSPLKWKIAEKRQILVNNKDIESQKYIDNMLKEIDDKDKLLSQIYQSSSWKLLNKVVRIKRYFYIYLKRYSRLIIIIFLFGLTVIVNLYLYLLKKLKKRIIFPGG